MAAHSATSLTRLSDSDQILAEPAEDIRGRHVQDRDGETLGKVADLLIDSEHGKVRFLVVEHGGVLGFGAKSSFIPIDAITRITDDVVYVGEPRNRIAGAPPYDPDLIEEPDYYRSMYDYYGYTPYWGAGYVYPGYPYLR